VSAGFYIRRRQVCIVRTSVKFCYIHVMAEGYFCPPYIELHLIFSMHDMERRRKAIIWTEHTLYCSNFRVSNIFFHQGVWHMIFELKENFKTVNNYHF